MYVFFLPSFYSKCLFESESFELKHNSFNVNYVPCRRDTNEKLQQEVRSATFLLKWTPKIYLTVVPQL